MQVLGEPCDLCSVPGRQRSLTSVARRSTTYRYLPEVSITYGTIQTAPALADITNRGRFEIKV